MFTGQQMPYNTPHMPVLMLEIILLLNCLERIVVMTFFFLYTRVILLKLVIICICSIGMIGY